MVNALLLRATSLILIAIPLNQLTAAVARQCTRKRSTVASSNGNRRQVGWCFINRLALSEPTKAATQLITTNALSSCSRSVGSSLSARTLSANAPAAMPSVRVPTNKNHSARPERRKRPTGAREAAYRRPR